MCNARYRRMRRIGVAEGEMITQEDTIFIQGMTPETTEEEIAERFGSIGVIKVGFWRRRSAPAPDYSVSVVLVY